MGSQYIGVVLSLVEIVFHYGNCLCHGTSPFLLGKILKFISRRYTIDEKLCTFALQSATVLPQVPPSADRLERYIVVAITKDAGMGRTVFVPLTDDLLYDHPERILGPVIPFSQQARRATVESAASSSTTLGLDTKTKLKTMGAYPANCSKRDKASLPQGGSPR